ncbi:MAG: radical SAM protein [Pirellulaceae bacterium]|nr:radical SAM protein [Pirellulaceae bacterium]
MTGTIMNLEEHRVPVAAFLPRSLVNGPGVRSVLWVQGCPLRCPGCFNPEFLEFSGGRPAPVEEVVGWILAERQTEGVTFSGGEPFAHAAVLARVAEAVRQAGKSVVVFTGFPRDLLFARNDDATRRLLDSADLLIAGPYQRERPAAHPWLSSTNQQLVFLTYRYSDSVPAATRKRVEYHIQASGTVAVTGFPARPSRELVPLTSQLDKSQEPTP